MRKCFDVDGPLGRVRWSAVRLWVDAHRVLVGKPRANIDVREAIASGRRYLKSRGGTLEEPDVIVEEVEVFSLLYGVYFIDAEVEIRVDVWTGEVTTVNGESPEDRSSTIEYPASDPAMRDFLLLAEGRRQAMRDRHRRLDSLREWKGKPKSNIDILQALVSAREFASETGFTLGPRVLTHEELDRFIILSGPRAEITLWVDVWSGEVTRVE